MKHMVGGGVIPRSYAPVAVFNRDQQMRQRNEMTFEQIRECLLSDNFARHNFAAESTFFELRENCERFVDALADDTFPDESLPHMNGLFSRWPVLRSVLTARYGFEEGKLLKDELFTPRVFKLWYVFDKGGYLPGKELELLLRMFDAGRADIDFLRQYFSESMQTRSDQADFYTQYLARDAMQLKRQMKSLDGLYNKILADPNRLMSSMSLSSLADYARMLIAAESIRRALTIPQWLPKLVAADEYETVKDFSSETLLALYQPLLPRLRAAEILNELTF